MLILQLKMVRNLLHLGAGQFPLPIECAQNVHRPFREGLVVLHQFAVVSTLPLPVLDVNLSLKFG